MEALFILLGIAVGAGMVWFVLRSRPAPPASTPAMTPEQLRDAFKALSADALRDNNQQFLQQFHALAQETLKTFQESARGDLDQRRQAIEKIVTPVQEILGKLETQWRAVETERKGDYGALNAQMKSMAETQNALRTETGNLVKALRAPHVRGRWGEMQLRRVVELAGMQAHCDFVEQQTAEANSLRPDLIVKLPGGKNLVVDAKTPLAAYLEAMEAPTEALRLEKMRAHVQQIREHFRKLGQKAYWEQFQPSPEFVFMFLPGEMFYSAALETAPDLLEESVNERVILATPTTLIALLKAVAYGWKEEALAENARQISDLGRELHERLGTMGGYFVKLGEQLGKAVDEYDKTVKSLESRVLVTARKFTQLSAGAPAEIAAAEPIDKKPRALQAPELTDAQER